MKRRWSLLAEAVRGSDRDHTAGPVGPALGAKDPDRAEAAVWTAGKYNAIVLGAVSVILIAVAPWIVSNFALGPANAPHAIAGVRFLGRADSAGVAARDPLATGPQGVFIAIISAVVFKRGHWKNTAV